MQSNIEQLEILYRQLANEAIKIFASNDLTPEELEKLPKEDFKRISDLNKQMFRINMEIIEELKKKPKNA